MTGQQLPDPMPEPELVAYGEVVINDTVLLMDSLDQLHIDSDAFVSDEPLTMEGYGLAYGMLSYTCAAALCTATSVCTQCPAACRSAQFGSALVYALQCCSAASQLVGSAWPQLSQPAHAMFFVESRSIPV